MPGGVDVPGKLADLLLRGDLVVGRFWAGLPRIVHTVDREVVCIVVDDKLVDRVTAVSPTAMSGQQQLVVYFGGFPVLHQNSLFQ